MRSDLSTDFQTAMAAAGRSPRLLCVFHFPKAGDVYVSDQALGAADGLSNEYAALIESWGDLRGAGDPRDPMASEVRQMTLTFWNGGDAPFSDYFLEEDPEDVVVDLYQWFAGLAESDRALIDVFVCQDPISSTEASRLLTIDLVSLPMRYDAPLGQVVTTASWPNAREEDLGRYLPIVLGYAGDVSTLVGRTAPKATLSGSILDDAMSVTANEDLDDEGFASVGTIQIGAERMTYSSRTSTVFTISQRGADGTTSAEHLNQAEIQQHVTNFTYLVGKGPVSALDGVKVGGLPAPAGIYTAYPVLDPARIVFSEKPYGIRYSAGSRFLEMQFDALSDYNTAWQAHLAMDPAAVTSAAQINETYPTLALRQVTSNPDRGPIVKAYLGVEWWASGVALQHDRVKVSIVGVADLGYLERPKPYDELTLDVAVDIDHGHTHSISGEHSHTFSNPAYAAQESPHTHGSSGLSTTQRVAATSQVSINMNSPETPGSTTIPGISGFNGAVLHFKTSPNYGCYFRVAGGAWVRGGSGDSYISISPPAGSFTLSFKWGGQGVTGTMMVYEIWVDYTINTTILPGYTGVAVTKVSDGGNAQNSDKAATDVTDLSTANRSVDIESSGLPTRTVVELFDLTSYVNFDWSWFTDKEIRVVYEGATDDETVYVLHCFFDVEYRQEERVFSDDVTANVTGLVDDASGTYTGTPNGLIRSPEHVREYLLSVCGGLSSDYIDATTFAGAGVRYAALGYGFDGVLAGDLRVREADRLLARQCRSRFFWDAGLAQIKVKECRADWTIDEDYVSTTAAIRLKGMAHERRRVADMINRVNLYYLRDWSGAEAGIGAYQAVSSTQDNASIAAHGIREIPERFAFDLVRDADMADDLAAFYLEEGAPSQFYTIDAFLPLFELQKEDHIRLTHPFMNLNKAAMRVADVERVFGSGKLKTINLLRIIAESWYRLIQVAKGDYVTPGDQFLVDMLWEPEMLDTIRASDAKSGWRVNALLADPIALAEAIGAFAWQLSESPTEALTTSDDLISEWNIETEQSETITTHEVYIRFALGAGFGLGSFGLVRFGEAEYWDAYPSEFLLVAESLAADEAAVLAESASVAETIIFSSGFGSPWVGDSGFGLELFGNILAVIKDFGLTVSVAVDDDIYFSSGFGSPWAGDSGFGDEPFGTPS